MKVTFTSFPVVRTDSLKGRRGRLPSKPKVIQDMSTTGSSASLIASLVRAHIGSNPGIGKLDYSKVGGKMFSFFSSLGTTNYSFRHLSEHLCFLYFQYDETEVSSNQKEDADDIRLFYDLLTTSLEVIKKWANNIPGFSQFSSEDQELLLESAFVELFILRLAYR